MRDKYNGAEKANPFAAEPDQKTIQDMDATIFGAGSGIDTGRKSAPAIPIMDIWPDMRQPRKAIPLLMRKGWDGNPTYVAGILEAWRKETERICGVPVDVDELISGARGQIDADIDGMPLWVSDYFDLVALAASIRHEGLINPITVVQRGPHYIIEAGERRWLAHHLLQAQTGDFGRINAHEMTELSVWRQAAENGNRKPLNAIGMARQLAVLIMDMYPEEDFGTYESMIDDGCDRPFYAQVADGNIWRVKRGLGEKVADVTGLSMVMFSRYRKLLTIPNDLWQKADLESWPEFNIRTKLEEQNRPDTLPIGKVSPENERHSPQQRPDRSTIVDLRPSAPTMPDEDEYEAWSEDDYDDYATDELTYEDDDDFDMPPMPQRSGAAGPFAGVPAADATPWLKPHARNLVDLYAQIALEMGDRELHDNLKRLWRTSKKSIMDQIAVGEYDQFHEWLQGTYNSLEPMLGNSITNIGNLLNDALQALGD